MILLITGGSGFIGSALAREAVAAGHHVVNVDKMTYAATLGSTAAIAESGRYVHERVDVVDVGSITEVLKRHQPHAIVHLAAESHVDRSIDDPAAFVTTNVVGTVSMLKAATVHWESLSGSDRDGFRFLHVSTDEVFGDLGAQGQFLASSPYAPRSPYAASKASADHFVRAWFETYGLPTLVSNCSNNYGPFQLPEKLIPLSIVRALGGQDIPVYGDGRQVRDWLYVADHADALLRILERGAAGSTYLLGGGAERQNRDVVDAICERLDERRPHGRPHRELVRMVTDRPGHDQRYSVDYSATTRAIGWAPSTPFDDGLTQTVDWYLDNTHWWWPLVTEDAATQRRGLRSDGHFR